MNKDSQSQWANPTPAMLFLVAGLLLGAGTFSAGLVPISCAPLMNAWSLAISIGVIMLAIIAFRIGDMAGGTFGIVLGFCFGIGQALSNIVQYIWPYFIYAAPGVPMLEVASSYQAIDPRINGFYLLVPTFFLFLMIFVMGRFSWIAGLSIVLLTTAQILYVSWLIAGAPGGAAADPSLALSGFMTNLTGWLTIISALLLLYSATSLLLASLAQREVLPSGRPMFK